MAMAIIGLNQSERLLDNWQNIFTLYVLSV